MHQHKSIRFKLVGFTDEDYTLSRTEGIIEESDVNTISTVSDTQIEVNETIEITAVVRDDRDVFCSTTVYILDGSKCIMYTVTSQS